MSKKLKIEKSKSEPKWNIFNCANTVFEGDIINGPHSEVFGNKKITIDGCFGVIDYNDTYIKLKLIKGCIILCGEGFNIAFFENKLITVTGKISSIEFCF